MGITDNFIIPKYASLVGDYVNKNLKPGDKIAWLGQQQKNKYSAMFKIIERSIEVENLEHHFYDIENDDDPPINNKWDVHDDWKGIIEGYDLVLGIRIAYLVQSSSGLIKNLQYATENNKKVLFDFNTGNLTWLGNDHVLQSWPDGSTNLIPDFKEVTANNLKIEYKVHSKDNLFSSEMLAAAGLELKDSIIFRDPVKGRFYILAEIVNK